MKKQISLIALTLTTLAVFAQNAVALDADLMPLACRKPIEVRVSSVVNNCDGTVTATYQYKNPNLTYKPLVFFGPTINCPELDIPVGISGIILPLQHWNYTVPGPSDGQPTHFLRGGWHTAFTRTFPANGSDRSWVVRYGLQTNTAKAKTSDAPADCPLEPKVDCMESIPGGGYRAYFRVDNLNTAIVSLPAGSENQFTGTISQDQGQPTDFAAYPSETTFTLEWDGSATHWSLTNGEQTNSAPSSGDIDLAFYNKVADDQLVNRCESQPINPVVSCVFDNADGTRTAWFGYESQRPGLSLIPVATLVNGANSFAPVAADQGQGDTFTYGGPYEGQVSVTWDPEVDGDEVRWHLSYGDSNPYSVAVANKDLNLCAPVEPKVCINQTLDGNQNGYLTAEFGYSNDNNFDISITDSNVNNLTGSATPQPTPGLTTNFVSGGEEAAFTVDFNDSDSVTWTVAGKSATAELSSALLCDPNELPSCEILGNVALACQGAETKTSLYASGSDPEGRAVTYSWTVECGDNSSYTVSNTNGDDDDDFQESEVGENIGNTLDLTLLDPGSGAPVNPVESGECVITLHVSDGFDSSSCSVDVTAPGCALDCNGGAIPDGEEAQVLPDLCGVCGGDNTSCQDCAGEPNGSSILDQQANPVCCLPLQIDECGVCFGDGSSCADCAGTPNGSAELDGKKNCCLPQEIDRCDVCGGDGSSCLGCEQTINTDKISSVENAAAQLREFARKLEGKVRRAKNSSPRDKSFAQIQLAIAADAFSQSSQHLSTIPAVITQCSNQEFCANISTSSKTEACANDLDTMLQAVKDLANRWKLVTGNRRMGRKITRLAKQVHAAAVQSLADLPKFDTSCDPGR